MNWKKEYDNDDRGGNWWDVTDGESSFRCMTEAEADFLLSKLQPAPVQQEPLGFMNAGNILEMQQKSLPYAYVYPVKSTGVSVAVYTSSQPAPAQQEPVAWPCLIAEADFSEDTVTLAMQCTDYKVSAGKHWLSNTPPAQRKPLTDEQVNLFINGRGDEGDDDYVEPTGDGFGLTDADLVRLVRRVEAAHGIKENK